MKDWTKKTMVEDEQSTNYQKKKDAKDVVHKELYKIYYKSPLLYIV